MSHSLATSSLLKAVGVDPGAAGTAGATAAVKWITKDGIGALGRLLVSSIACYFLLQQFVVCNMACAIAAVKWIIKDGMGALGRLLVRRCSLRSLYDA